MIRNPLLDPPEAQPIASCPTGWEKLPFPGDGYRGYSEIALQGAGVVRVWKAGTPSASVCARLYHPGSGTVAGIYTEDGRFRRMQGNAGRNGKILADDPGRHLLMGHLPYSDEPIMVEPDSPLASFGLTYRPFSVLSHVLVTAGGPGELLDATVAAYTVPAMRAYTAVPVLCLPRAADGQTINVSTLSKVRLPPNTTILATGEKLADQIAEEIFVDVDEWPF